MRFLFIPFLLFIFLDLHSQSNPIIVDHRHAKLEPITVEAINKAKDKLHIAYSSTSHGSQITEGMKYLMNLNNSELIGYKGDIYDYNNGGENGALDLHYRFAPGAYDLSSDENNWDSATRKYLDKPENADVNVVMWSWCNIIGHDIDYYLQRMEQLISEYGPGGTKIQNGERTTPVIFVFMTGHSNRGSNNKATFNANKKIRKHCLENNRVLYDFYDIECYDPDGNYFGDGEANAIDYGDYTGIHNLSDGCDYNIPETGKTGNWARKWQDEHKQNKYWYWCNAAHSEPLNGNLKTYAAWSLWTKLANLISNPSGNSSATITSSQALTENNLDNAVINFTLTNETFQNNSLSASNFTLNNAPQGTSVGSVSFVNNKQANITIHFNGTDFDNDIDNFNITVNASELKGNDNITSNNLSIKAVQEPKSATITSSQALTENNLDNAVINFTLTNETFQDNSLSASNFILNNAPQGASVGSVSFVNNKQANITIHFNGTDFDNDIDNFNITVNANELKGNDNITSNNLSITAVQEPKSAKITSSQSLTENNLDNAVINFTLTNETFQDNSLSASNFILNNAPQGASVGSVNFVNNKQANITIHFNGTDFDNNIDNFNITVNANELKGNDNITSNNLSITAVQEPKSATITSSQALTENNLDNSVINFTLTNETFQDNSLSASNFTLNNAPQGTSVGSVSFVNNTQANITIHFNGTDFDNDINNFNITVNANELKGNDNITSNNLSIKAVQEPKSATITSSQALTENNLDNAVINFTLTNETFKDNSLSASNFTLHNAPEGTSVSSVSFVNNTQANITIHFNGTDFDNDINNFNITVNANELKGNDNITSNNLSITAVQEPKSATITSSQALTENNLDNAVINFTLTNETFQDNSLSASNFTLNNAPEGTSINSVNYTSDTQATITIIFNGTDFDNDINNFNITVNANELKGNDNITSNNLSITAVQELKSATITSSQSLTENNLDNAVINFTLTNETFQDNSLSKSNFTLNNAPQGTSVGSVSFVNNTQATITIIFNGTDFDNDIDNFNITVNANELKGNDNITSNNLSIKAVQEPKSATITSSQALTENNLDNAVINFTLTNETFEDNSLSKSNFTLNNAPEGTSINSVNYTSDTQATITIIFNGTDFDNDIDNFNITVNANELKGNDNITSNNLSIKAVQELKSATITSSQSLTENNLDNAVINFTLTNETFEDNSLSKYNFTLNNAPEGTSINSVNYTSYTQATITIIFNGTDFDNDIDNFNITVNANELKGNDSITSNNLSIKAVQELKSATITSSQSLTENNLDNAVINFTLTNETFEDNSLSKYNFTLNNAPEGTSINSVNYTSDTQATITIIFNSTDFDNDIDNFNITVNANELKGNDNITSNNLSIKAVQELKSATITSSQSLTENNLDNAVINFTLTNETFEDNSLSKYNFTLNNAPEGTSVGSISFVNNTQANITISFNGTDFDSDINNFNITVNANELKGNDNITSNNLKITAVQEFKSATITTLHALTENNLDNAVINFTLTNETFKDNTLSASNFTLNNAPEGTSIGSVSYISNTQANIIISFDGTDFDTNIKNFNIKVNSSALTGNDNITSNNIRIAAINERGSVIISPEFDLKESNLDGAVIMVNLENEYFKDSYLNNKNFILKNAPKGVAINNINYLSNTEAELILSYDKTDFDSDINNFKVIVKSVELVGSYDLISNEISIIANVETNINNVVDSKFIAYPNPADNFINVEYETKSDKDIIIYIIDISGKRIYNKVFGSSPTSTFKQTIDLHNINKGYYNLVLQQEAKTLVQKIIIK